MKIAITIFRYRVSPVFDWSERLLIIEKIQNDEKIQKEISLENLNYMEKVEFLVEMKVNVLICGVISDSLLPLLESKNICVIPGVAGKIDEVIEAFFAGQLKQEKFTMPGCHGLRRRQHRFCRGHSLS
ncbi:MAG: NifB/NifX family molybdenum-iron cluster-binding protein [Desulfobacterales bacterium]|nr:NifB/NifX family molybdenum-iron cluster-binding protein [Desulfobacterales bacterium]